MGAEFALRHERMARARALHQVLEEGARLLRRGGGGKPGAHPARGIRREGKLRHEQQVARGGGEIEVHALRGVGENAVAEHALGEALRIGGAIACPHGDERHDAGAAAGLSAAQAVWIGLAAAAVAVVLRMMFVAPLVGALRRDAARAVSAKPELEKMQSRVADRELLGRFSPRRVEHIGQRVTRLLADIDFMVAESFGWRGGVVLAWSGMRGVVTVAAAESLPDDTPYRPQLVLIAFVVAATTLLAQGLTLPRVIRVLKISGDDAAADRAEYRELLTDLTGTARAILDDPDLSLPDGSPYPAAVLDRVRQDALVPSGSAVPDAEGDADPRDQYRQLMLQLLAAERARLLAARSAGTYTSRTLTRAQRAMDLMEATLQQIPDLAEPG